MASFMDFFMPQAQQAAPQPDMNSVMSNPAMLNALLAFGTNAMIPQWGGGAVQFAKGVGGAGEAATAQQEAERKQQETESKSQLREAQAGAAEARANTAGTRASLTGLIEEGKRQRADLATRVRLSNLYQNYIRDTAARNKAIEAQNNNPLRPPGAPPTPLQQPLPMNEWIASNPMLQNLGLTSPPAAKPGATDEGDDGAALPPGAGVDAASVAQAPQDPKQRQAGMTYMTPKGPLKWTGTGWVNP